MTGIHLVVVFCLMLAAFLCGIAVGIRFALAEVGYGRD